MKTGLAIVTLGAMLAGCGSGGGTNPAANTSAAAATPDPTEAKLNAATETQRRTAFFRAIYDSDFTCDQIVSFATKPRDQNRPVWLVTCDDHGEYLITLQPGGVFIVSGVTQPKRRMPKGTKIIAPGADK
jgi:hypothetical protein